MRWIIIIIVLLGFQKTHGQELFVVTDPASNVPANSLAVNIMQSSFKEKFEKGYNYHLMPEVTYGLSKNLMFPIKVIHSIWKAISILQRFKPDVVVGVGGYASGPALFAAVLLKIPTVIQEQNSYAGVTNKILARFVDKIGVAFPDMDLVFPAKKMV